MENLNSNNIINKRVLLKIGQGYQSIDVAEYKVLEFSPSGTWVKLQNTNGNKFWKAIQDVALVEILRDLREDRPTEA